MAIYKVTVKGFTKTQEESDYYKETFVVDAVNAASAETKAAKELKRIWKRVQLTTVSANEIVKMDVAGVIK